MEQKNMKYIGAHVSISGGVENAPVNAASIGAKAFAMFTKNQLRWQGPPLTGKNISSFKKNCRQNMFDARYILPHDTYLINLGHPDPKALEKSQHAFIDEMKRCEALGLKYLNFHPGSHLNKIDLATCLERISRSIDMALEQSSGVTAVIENTAGQGSNVGFRFEHLARIIQHVQDKTRIGVCIDTCHLFTSGYDIKTEKTFEDTFKEFDSIVGIHFLKGMHLNDSKKNCGSRVDRHESVGKGSLGLEPFRFIMNDSRFDNMPLILETPDNSIWNQEIKLLYSLAE